MDDQERAARRRLARRIMGSVFFAGVMAIIVVDACLFTTDNTITISATWREFFGEGPQLFWSAAAGSVTGLAIVAWTGWGLTPIGRTAAGIAKWWFGCLFILGGAGMVAFDFFWYCWGRPSIFRWISVDVGSIRACLYAAVVAGLGLHFIGWSTKGRKS